MSGIGSSVRWPRRFRRAATGNAPGMPPESPPSSLTAVLSAARGPVELVLVRHGQSAGNLADQDAQERGAEELDLDARDADVELSPTGQEQANALTKWLPALQADDPPTIVLSSPHPRGAGNPAPPSARPPDDRAQLPLPAGCGHRAHRCRRHRSRRGPRRAAPGTRPRSVR